MEFPSFPKNNSREILGKELAFSRVNLHKISREILRNPGKQKVKMRIGKIPEKSQKFPGTRAYEIKKTQIPKNFREFQETLKKS